ncbi:Permease, cytosine/purine, uracil, thiamine, allantoin [Penicillium expansum]|uniref:Permease, cytosine/purine, uracil, thiamine, allantoin n=1 Tax=Penicillium expansum TaxID=27334 RepID=A0A0A2J7M1_PENEN|nr:Permease, cytosine/purine, uracil, thiamine, allantoin [Penicillium expansum]KGO51334.1 Permease, cytosine/purine, uracil, thiamine, allantoin [Penicillium expansum]
MSKLSRLHELLLVKRTQRDGIDRPVDMLDNDSIRPTPLKDRTWTQLTYIMFWFSATANVSNLYTASTGMAMGLTMWEAIGCSFGGQILAGALMAINGRAGAMYRIPFPVLCRSSFGHWGALWPTFNRAVMSIVWNGVNTVQGGQCLLINCAFLVVPVPKMKSLVYIKVVVYFGAAFAMLGWTVSLAGGSLKTINAPSKVHGSEKSFLIFRFLFLGLASCGTFISNASDLQRYARKPNDVLIGQFISFPLSNFLVAILGNLIASASKAIFGELIWSPLNFLDKLMEGERYTSGNRAACAFISLAFVYSTVFSAIFENSIPAGNDIAALLPKYISIKRGFFICAVLSFAICPWYLLASASIFITFLSSYQIFLSAITGILICDYYLIRRGLLNIPALYVTSPSPYRYFHGFNPRAFLAYVIAIAPNFYGFLHQMGVKAPLGIQRFYYIAYPTGLIIAFVVYYVSCLASPPADMKEASGWIEPKDFVEDNDASGSDGYTINAVEPDFAEKGNVAVTTAAHGGKGSF